MSQYVCPGDPVVVRVPPGCAAVILNGCRGTLQLSDGNLCAVHAGTVSKKAIASLQRVADAATSAADAAGPIGSAAAETAAAREAANLGPTSLRVEVASARRYVPVTEDRAIGIVAEKRAESFLVDINGPGMATLPALAFEGATRRNRPNLQVGSLVVVRVTLAGRDVEAEVSCMDASGQTKAVGLGPLTGGNMWAISAGLARTLLQQPPCAVLAALAKSLAFELAVGVNGRMWVSTPAGTPMPAATIVLVGNAILGSELLSAEKAESLVRTVLMQRVHGS